MNRPFQSALLLAVGLTAVLALSSCSQLSQYLPGGGNQSPQSSQSSSSAPDASSSQTDAEEQTIQGILNQVDKEQEYLILIADDAYCRFDFSESGADLSGLEPGDSVTVTYTGTLDQDSEEITAKLVSISKDA